MPKVNETTPGMPVEVQLWAARANSPNPWLLIRLQTDEGLRYRAVYWSLKNREFMVSTTTYISMQAFIQSRLGDKKISTAAVPLRKAIIDGWMPDILTGS